VQKEMSEKQKSTESNWCKFWVKFAALIPHTPENLYSWLRK